MTEPSDALAAINVEQTLDVKGLACPLPILKAKQALSKMNTGDVLHVIATDPASPIDFRALCLRSAHELVDVKEGGDLFEFFLRKG